MSWKASGIVKEMTEGLTAREKFLLLLLSEHANPHTGQCNPSIPLLAKELLSSKRHLYRLLGQLKAKGFIRVDSGGGTRSNQYWLSCVDAFAVTPDTMSPPDTTGMSPLTPRSVTPDTHVRQKERERKVEKSSLSSSSKTSERGTHKEIDPDFLADMTTTFPGVDVERELSKFDDWKAAKGRRFKDDRAAFRNWLRKAEEFAGERKQRDTVKAGRGAIRGEDDLAAWDAYKNS